LENIYLKYVTNRNLYKYKSITISNMETKTYFEVRAKQEGVDSIYLNLGFAQGYKFQIAFETEEDAYKYINKHKNFCPTELSYEVRTLKIDGRSNKVKIITNIK